MSRRIHALEELSQAGHYSKAAKQLSAADFDRLVSFINKNDGLSHLDFEYAVNRMFLDLPKPKNWSIIVELACAINTKAHGTLRRRIV